MRAARPLIRCLVGPDIGHVDEALDSGLVRGRPAAGYVGAHLYDPKAELGAAYDEAMQKKIFDPLGMSSTTFDMARALKGNHALPHGDTVDGQPSIASMDFNYSDRTKELQAQLLRFMDDHIYPAEARYEAEIEANTKEGTQFGVRGTPGFFINGRFLRGAQPFESFR